MIGDKDQDGFYWGELRGRRGFVPHNMVTEIDESQNGAQGASSSGATVTGPTNTATPGGKENIKQNKKTFDRKSNFRNEC